MTSQDQPIDVVASVGPLDRVVVTLRDFLHRSGAVRAVAVVEGADIAVVDCSRLTPIEVQVGERVVHLPHAIELDAAPLGEVEIAPLPPFEVDREVGEVTGAIGGVAHLAEAVRSLAALLGGRSVAMAQLETTTPDVLLSVTARGDDPIVVSIGEDEYEMDPGWP